MKLTAHQRRAVEYPCHALVVACPGSGKTRTIIAKLLRCADDVRDTPRRVACITYTNAAVHEIEDRVRLYGAGGESDYCDIATIHAFCQDAVLRHFHWRLPEYRDGYTILPPDCDAYTGLVEEIADKYGLSAYARQQFEQLNRTPTGEPICPADIPPEAARAFWMRLQKHKYIDFCNIVYCSYRLLVEDPGIARNLASRYKHVLVDEFQDTSALQVEILKLIAGHDRTSFFLVGDPEQSIYSFAGAERQLMFDFAEHLGAREIPLSGNFRSSAPVVQCAESLLPRSVPMFAAGEAAACTELPCHEHVENHFTGITDYFLPMVEGIGIPFGDCAILAPTWFQLRPLGQKLREYGVPVVGPGARPYKRSHLFARLAEVVCAYIHSPSPRAVPAIEKEVFHLINTVTGRPDYRVFSFQGRRVVFQLLHAARDLRALHEGAVPWLHAAVERFGEILHAAGFVPKTCGPLMAESVSAMLRDMEKAEVDLANLAFSDLGIFASPEGNVKLLTIHQAKGREFAAVAVIALHDGILPYHNRHSPLTRDGEAEARRVLYVAITRAKRVLMLFTNREEWRQQCRFLGPLSLPKAPPRR